MLSGHDALVGHLQLQDDILVTGGSDGRVCVVRLNLNLNIDCQLLSLTTNITSLQFPLLNTIILIHVVVIAAAHVPS